MTAPDLLPWMWNPGSDPQVDDDLMEKWLYSAMLHPSKLKPTMHKLVQHLSGDKERVVPNNRATPADRIAALTEQLAAARRDAEEAEAYAGELEKERDEFAAKLAGDRLGQWIEQGMPAVTVPLKQIGTGLYEQPAPGHVNEKPKTEHDAGNVLTPAPDAAAIRKAALVLLSSPEALFTMTDELLRGANVNTPTREDAACVEQCLREALALITEKPHDR